MAKTESGSGEILGLSRGGELTADVAFHVEENMESEFGTMSEGLCTGRVLASTGLSHMESELAEPARGTQF